MLRPTIAVSLLCVAWPLAFGQSSLLSAPVNRDRLVTSPESLSGLWEASDGDGGIIGIHLELVTRIPGSATSLANVQQTWEQLSVAVFQTKTPMLEFGDENYFTDSPDGVQVRLDKNRLSLHLLNPTPQTPSIDLDLKRVNDTWIGRFHRGDFDAHVELRRPGTKVETWIADSPMGRSCLHIPQSNAPELNGWSDNIPTFGNVRYANNIPRPATADASYGNLVKIRHLGDNQLSIEFNAYSAICCSHTFVGTISPDRKLLTGPWPTGPNQAPHPGAFRKASGSCANSAP